MLRGIVSSKKGHDESHIDETKLRTKFWNVVDKVTIRLTQKYWHKICFNYRGKLLFFLWTSGGTTQDLATMTRRVRTEYDSGQCIIWKAQRSDMNHEIGSNCNLAEYPIDWIICRQVPCSKVTNNYHLFAKWFPSLNSPIMIDECLFSFLRVQRG